MKSIFTKIKNAVFNESAVNDAQLELEATRRDILKYQTIVENYTAQVAACKSRITRLQAFLEASDNGLAGHYQSTLEVKDEAR